MAIKNLPAISDIDLRLLRVFKTIVECGGFTQAQIELGIGGSTISTHMSTLETRLGLTLCRRGRGGFSLTERGRLVYESATRFLTAIEGFRSELGELQGKMSGEIKVGMVDNLSTNTVCKLHTAIEQFREQTEDVHLTIQVVAPNQIENWLTRGLLHLALMPRLPLPDTTSAEYLFVEKQALYCGSNHQLFDMSPEDITQELLSQQAFVRRGYSVEANYDALFSGPAAATAFHMEGVAQFILSGKYVGFLPIEYAESHWGSRGEMRSLLPEIFGFEVPIFLVHSSIDSLSLPVNVLRKLILANHVS